MKLHLHFLFIFATSLAGVIRQVVVSAFAPNQSVAKSPRLPTSFRQMFTGIVEEMGIVVSLEEREDMSLWDGSKGKGTELVVQGDIVMEGAYLG
jgi:hypothetical protein